MATRQKHWRCPNAGHTPFASIDEMPDTRSLPLATVARAAQRVRGQIETPCTCPLAPLYGPSHPLVDRVVEGAAAIEDGLSERTAFPGGVKAVDLVALRVYRRGRAARQHSDDAHRERDRRRREDEAAARKTR